MEIVKKTEGNKATLEIRGWLDTQTAPQLQEALSELEDSITSLVFDFAKLEYISSRRPGICSRSAAARHRPRLPAA